MRMTETEKRLRRIARGKALAKSESIEIRKAHRANQQVAGLALLKSGRATTAEVARLLKSSRQRVQAWVQTRGLDVAKARAKWLERQWKTELEKPALEKAARRAAVRAGKPTNAGKTG
jgi:hypothetical protein